MLSTPCQEKNVLQLEALLAEIARIEWKGLVLFWKVIQLLRESRKNRKFFKKVFDRCASQQVECQADCLKQALPCLQKYRNAFAKHCTTLERLPLKPLTIRLSLKALEREWDAWEDLLEDYTLATSEEFHSLVHQTMNALRAA